jgi:hypothetical protein
MITSGGVSSSVARQLATTATLAKSIARTLAGYLDTAQAVCASCCPIPACSLLCGGYALCRVFQFSEIPTTAPFNRRKQRSVIGMQHV